MFIKKHEPLKAAFNVEFSYFTSSFRHVKADLVLLRVFQQRNLSWIQIRRRFRWQ